MAMSAGQIATIAQIELQGAKRPEPGQAGIDGFDGEFESLARASADITHHDAVPRIRNDTRLPSEDWLGLPICNCILHIHLPIALNAATNSGAPVKHKDRRLTDSAYGYRQLHVITF